MDLKRVLSLCVALLLIAGAAGDVFATEIFRIQVAKPAAGTYAVIGGTVEINLLINKNFTFDSLRVALSNRDADEAAEFGEIEDKNDNAFQSPNPFNKIFATVAAVTADRITTDARVDSIKIVFPVDPGAIETETATEIEVQLAYRLNGTSDVVILTNQSTEDASPTGVVGDQVKFGIDNKRPLAGIIDALTLEGGTLVGNLPEPHTDGVTRAYGIGDTMRVVLGVSNPIGVKVKIYILSVDDTTTSDYDDEALKIFTFSETVLLNTIGDVRDSSFILAEGDLFDPTDDEPQSVNGVRVKAIGFVSDDAGNLGGAAVNSASAIGFTDDERHVVDTDAPDIEIAVPVTGGLFTGGAESIGEAFVDTDDDDKRTTTSSKTFSQNPADVAIDEIVVERLIIADGDTTTDSDFPAQTGSGISVGDTLAYSVTENDSTDATGSEMDFEFQAVDSVGNLGSLTIEDAILDNVAITVDPLFPSSATEDTISPETSSIVMRIGEEADSISIRYIELIPTGEVPITHIKSVTPASRLEKVGEDITVDFSNDFDEDDDDRQYTLQVFARDLAGNISLTPLDTLLFDDEFENPQGHIFKVANAASVDSIIVGRDLDLEITAWDTILGKPSVTYPPASSEDALVSIWVPTVDEDGEAGVALADSGQFIFTDDEQGITVNSDGTGALDRDGWSLGERTVSVTTHGVIADVAVMVQELSTAVVVDQTTGEETEETAVEVAGEADSTFTFDAEQFAVYAVTIWQGGEQVTSALSAEDNEFTINVTPVDVFGNLSTKISAFGQVGNTDFISSADSSFLYSRLDTDAKRAHILASIFVQFSTNIADAALPQGPQAVSAGGSEFIGFAPVREGTGLVVTVRTANISGDPTVFGPTQQSATGSSPALGFGGGESVDPGDGDGEAPPLAGPENLIVDDYRGPMGEGDQGGYILVSFPHSIDHSNVDFYQLYREIWVNTVLAMPDDGGDGGNGDGGNGDGGNGDGGNGDGGNGDGGNGDGGNGDGGNGEAAGKAAVERVDDPVAKWVPWAQISSLPVPADQPGYSIARAVVPSLDNEPSNWAVRAVSGRRISGATASSKRVFTKESVQQMIQLLGVDPNRVISHEEIAGLFSPSKDLVSSIIGEQKNLVLAALDVDVSSLLTTSTLPQSIRTASSGVRISAPAVTEEPVGAVDNIAPAAATELKGEYSSDDENVSLSWEGSTADRVVGYSTYRGYVVPIAGVERYEVWRGADGADLEMLMPLLPGSSSFIDDDLPEGASTLVYRIDALDTNPANRALSETAEVTLEVGYVDFRDADNERIFVVDLDPARVDFTVGFRDFVIFARAFGKSEGDEGYLLQADTNQDRTINFVDFTNFVSSFGKTPVTRNGQPLGATKPVFAPTRPGVNENAEMLLSQNSDRVIAGQPISVDVSVANVKAMQGFGFVLTYDPEKFEFVGAAPADEDLLKSGGGETPLFFEQSEPGQLTVANVVINDEVVSGEGSVVTLTFKVLREFEDNARFEIAEGVVFDHDQLSNPMVVLGALNVETTPTEFALLQNFPNPFNPETTIKYNLAEGSDVHLRIYNIVGQVVRTLVGERQSAGRYQVQWNGTDDRGMPVSSGIYFYQVSAGKFQDVKRLMLLK